jgi:hypothetical protein
MGDTSADRLGPVPHAEAVVGVAWVAAHGVVAQALALGDLQAVVAAAGIAQQAPLQGLQVMDAAHRPSTSRFQQPLAEQGIEVRAAAGDHVHRGVDAALADGAHGA